MRTSPVALFSAALPLVAAASLTGCLSSEVTASSRTYLGPTGSGAVVSRSVDETALEVTRLLEVRGYTLTDIMATAPSGERRLKFTRASGALASDNEFYSAREVGLVFYAWVTPDHAGAGATVSLLGKPTLAGAEPCTNDGVLLNCTHLSVRPGFADRYLRGKAETEVAHGVLSQLQLEGFVERALPADAPLPTPDVEAKQQQAEIAECRVRQHDAVIAAGQEKDPKRHAAMIRSVPRCAGDK